MKGEVLKTVMGAVMGSRGPNVKLPSGSDQDGGLRNEEIKTQSIVRCFENKARLKRFEMDM